MRIWECNGSLALSRIAYKLPLEKATPDILYETLILEIKRLILKGMYQLIKNKFSFLSDKEIIEKLYLNDIAVLQKYGLSWLGNKKTEKQPHTSRASSYIARTFSLQASTNFCGASGVTYIPFSRIQFRTG